MKKASLHVQPEIKAKRCSFDGMPIQFWTDGRITLGSMQVYAGSARGKRKVSADILKWADTYMLDEIRKMRPSMTRVAGLVTTRLYKDIWLAKALRISGTEVDSMSREGRDYAVAELCRAILMKPSDFIEEQISANEYHYLLRPKK